MNGGVMLVLGGIGMFLFGLKIMTEALREAAGHQLRHLLARFTTTPLTGVATGTAVTALVQSSSATTVMTIGFVGAGLLSFPQALGVIYGANIGTTVTGWMVTLLGFKLQLGTLALPALFCSSLLALLARGTAARIGQMLSGLCLLFVGLDMMQNGAAGFDDWLTPRTLPQGGLWGDLQLIGIGLLVTLVMQSSSAAMAIALVLLSSAAISFEQGAAMVIGMNLGTTFTALLASVGGSVTMRQTATANLFFNIGTALLAYPLLVLSGPVLERAADHAGETTALVLFHTGFNLVGTLIFLPITHPFARWVERIVPDRAAGSGTAAMISTLDRALLHDAGAAMDATQTALRRTERHVFLALGAALAPVSDMRGMATLGSVAVPALEAIKAYLAQITSMPKTPAIRERYAALLHQTDHLTRLLRRIERKAMIGILLTDPGLSRISRAFGAAVRRAGDDACGARDAARLRRLSTRIAARTIRHRRATLLQEHVGLITVSEMFDRTDAMRWLTRVADHVERIVHYRGRAVGVNGQQAPDVPGPRP